MRVSSGRDRKLPRTITVAPAYDALLVVPHLFEIPWGYGANNLLRMTGPFAAAKMHDDLNERQRRNHRNRGTGRHRVFHDNKKRRRRENDRRHEA